MALSFAAPSDESIDYLGCQGDGFSMLVGTQTFDESNPAGNVMLTNAAGCDSLVTVDLNFQPNQLNEIVHNGCEGDGFSVEVDGIIYDETNPIGNVRLIGPNGCDSTISVSLSFSDAIVNEIRHAGCEADGFNVVVNNVTYDQFNPVGRDTLTSSFGCDSIVDVSLNFAAPSDERIDYLGCQGDGFSVVVGNESFDESRTTGSVLLMNSEGCDSLVTVDLNFQVAQNNDIVHNGCLGDGFSVEVNGIVYDESNPSARIELVGASGCDSIINIDLSFSDVLTNSIVHDGCSGDGFSVEVNNIIYDESNPVGQEMFVSAAGCDSIVDVSLSFGQASSSVVDYLGCIGDGFSVAVNNTLYSEQLPSGTEVLTNRMGCDSTVSIDLVFQDMFLTDVDHQGCSGDGFSVEVNGVVYDESNPFGTEMTTSTSGCDSLIMVDLIFSDSDTTMVGGVVCSNVNAFRVINGTIYDENNTSGVEVLQTVNGCDSVLLIDFSFVEGVTTEFTDTLCSQSSVTIGNTIYDRFNSTGTETFAMPGGCDSVVQVNITFYDEPNFSVSLEPIAGSPSFQLNVTNADLISSISWDSDLLDCTDCLNPIITTDQNTGFTASIVDVNGCETTIAVPIIIRQDDVNVYIPNAIRPSSTQGNNMLRPVLPDGVQAAFDIDIFDRYGGILFRQEGVSTLDQNAGWNGNFRGELAQTGVFVYKIVVYLDGQDPMIMSGTVSVF